MKIVTIIGTRPQFIKASALSRVIRIHNQNINNQEKIEEIIVHTGQHFDKNMSDIFFSELEISKPDYNLKVSNLTHGAMTGRMLESIENILQNEQPNLILIYGDTNSTLAGALAASKLHIPIVHIEAGLRSFNNKMPEEINRILVDRISTQLFCPTQTAVNNLNNEGITQGIYNVGDIMYDVTLHYQEKAKQQINLNQWKVKEKGYVLCTIHRAENTDNIARLSSILEALREIAIETQVLLPIHPRTKQLIQKLNKEEWLNGITILKPLSYLEMLRLEISAKAILTDSGGVQKEAFFNHVPCITMRDETEWVETVELGWNLIAGANKEKILATYNDTKMKKTNGTPYGNGQSSLKILQKILSDIN
jgi:UDP-GlcNAc3NAcA epimerase